MASSRERAPLLPGSMRARLEALLYGVLGYIVLAICFASAVSLLTWSIADPSFTHATSGPTRNLLGPIGAIVSDLTMQLLGVAGVFIILPPVFWGLQLVATRRLDGARAKVALAPVAVVLLACAASSLPKVAVWPLPYGFGGLLGDQVLRLLAGLMGMIRPERASAAAGLFCFAGGLMLLMTSIGLSQQDLKLICGGTRRLSFKFISANWSGNMADRMSAARREPTLRMPSPPPPTVRATLPRAEPVFDLEPRITSATDFFSGPTDEDFSAPVLTSGDDNDVAETSRIAKIFAPRVCPKSPHPAAMPRLALPLSPSARPGAVGPPYAIWATEIAMAPSPAGRPALGAPPLEKLASKTEQSPATPTLVPATVEAASPPAGLRPQGPPGGADLYGRAVAIVLGDRKASIDYLQQRLAIGYMRAADLIDRMEREGILGAPVYNGMRPILLSRPGACVV